MKSTENGWDEIELYHDLQQTGLIPVHGDFFPAVHYPPITRYAPLTEEEAYAGFQLPENNTFDIYVHIPFCLKRCIFCHYPSKYNAPDEEKDRYLEALKGEMDLFLQRIGANRIRTRAILIGGGTPTDLTPKQLEYFLQYFTERAPVRDQVQFNYDVDPNSLIGPVGLERLKLLKDYGVNRLTIGVQSLNDPILKGMNRAHTAAEAIESVNNSLEAGFKVNIEFIFGFPGQTMDIWNEDIRLASTLNTDEIQLYRLKYEPYGDQVGIIKNYREKKQDDLVSVEETLRMKRSAIRILAEQGYLENLRRVYTRSKDNISRYAYNQCCRLLDQVGFGQTAFASYHDRFLLNPFSFEEYYGAIDSGRLPLNRGIVRSLSEQMRWSIILPLKNYYLPKKLFYRRTGHYLEDTPFISIIHRLIDMGLVEESDMNYTLTEQGAFFADEVTEAFYSHDYIPFPESDYLPGPLNPYNNDPGDVIYDQAARSN